MAARKKKATRKRAARKKQAAEPKSVEDAYAEKRIRERDAFMAAMTAATKTYGYTLRAIVKAENGVGVGELVVVPTR